MMYARRRKMILAAAGSLYLFVPRAQATLLLYEPFNYTSTTLGGTAGNPTGQVNPYNTQTWYARHTGGNNNYTAANDTQIGSGSLSYGGLAPSTGNSVNYGTNTSGVANANYDDVISLGTPITLSGSGNSVYYSFIVTLNGSGPDTAPGVGARQTFISLATTTADSASRGTDTSADVGGAVAEPASVWLRPDGDSSPNYQFGVGKNNSDGISQAAGAGGWQSHTATGSVQTAPTANQHGNTSGYANSTVPATYFVVAKYTFGSTVLTGTQKDSVTIYVNPNSFTLGDNSSETLAITNSSYSATNAYGTATLDAGTIRSLILASHRQTTSDSASVSVDEIRVGTTWADVTPTGLVWDGNADSSPNPSDNSGAWETANNWYNGSTAASSTWVSGQDAQFGTGAGSGSVSVNLSSPQVAGKLTFISASPNYTVSGSAITLNGAGGAGIVANQSATVSSDINVASTQTWYVAASSTLTTGNVSGAGGLTKSGPGTLVASNIRTSDLTVSTGLAQIAANGSNAGTSAVSTVSVAAGAQLDLTNNHLVVHATPIGTFTGGAYTGVTGLVQSGRNGGAWNGSGIVSSNAAASSGLTALAVASASDVLGISGAQTAIWSGQTVSATDTLVKYTYGGDANLSGKIDADDYFQIDSHYNKSGASFGYFNGDFNYDGVINGDDYFIIDSNFSDQGAALAAPFSGIGAVPEPATISLLILAAPFIFRRRRKNEVTI